MPRDFAAAVALRAEIALAAIKFLQKSLITNRKPAQRALALGHYYSV